MTGHADVPDQALRLRLSERSYRTVRCKSGIPAGLIGEVVKLYEETLEAMVKVLGPEHPDTLSSRSNLILSYRQAGRDADADALAADERFPAADEG